MMKMKEEKYEIYQIVFSEVPKDRVPLAKEDTSLRLQAIKEAVVNEFGGYTAVAAVGGYVFKDGKTIVIDEPSHILYISTAGGYASIKKMAIKIGRIFEQESVVAVKPDNTTELIFIEEASK